MLQTRSLLLCIGLIANMLLLQSCSTTSEWRPETNFSETTIGEPTAYAVPDKSGQNNVLVTLRFPAVVDEKAKFIFKERYASERLSFPPEVNDEGKAPLVENVELEALNKTAYYVLEFYQALAAKLPPGTVVLQPTKITLNENGGLIETVQEEFPPSVLVADFFAYVYPARPMYYEPQTFGDLITPLLTVRTSVQASPTTLGALVGTEYLLPPTISGDVVLSKGLGRSLVDYLRDGMAHEHVVPHNHDARPLKKNHVMTLALTEVEMDEDLLIEQSVVVGGAPFESTPAHETFEFYANSIVDALNIVDHERATRDAHRKYIHRIDSDLARQYPFHVQSKKNALKLKMLHAFEAAERKVLAKTSIQAFEKTYPGSFGENMRDLFVSEWEQAEKMRSNLKSQYASQFMGLLSAGAAGFTTGLATTNPGDATLLQTSSQLNQTAMMSMFTAVQLGSARSELSQGFESSLMGVREGQMNYQVRFEDEVINIQAKNLNEVRRKFQEYYSKKLGIGEHSFNGSETESASLILSSPECGRIQLPLLTVPQDNLTVKWTGVCRNGQANGNGVAQWFQEGQYRGEYAGTMKDGKAHGNGSAILPIEDSPFFYSMEGEFVDGQPKGNMVVNRPGRPSPEIDYKDVLAQN